MPNWPAAGRRSLFELYKMIGERFRSGDLGPEQALHLFDELLLLATPDSVYALTKLITVIANAPASSSVRDGPALAISLFKRMAQAGTTKVAPNLYTYNILICCCCRVGRLDLAFASLALVIKTGWTPNVISYNTLLNGLCKQKRSQEALDLLHRMAGDGGNGKCPPDVVSYNTIIDGFLKVGEVGKAYSVFREMLGHGIPPNVVTYTSVIDGLCKVQEMHKAEEVFQHMFDKGVRPNSFTYCSLLHGFCS
jgi:pentatricopeptide repeat protein